LHTTVLSTAAPSIATTLTLVIAAASFWLILTRIGRLPDLRVFDGHLVVLVQPTAEVGELTAFGAEGLESRVRGALTTVGAEESH
jgi:hypothetical protein